MNFIPPIQVAHYAYDAGFRGSSLVTAVAVADGESTFNASAVSPTDTCFGLWQINKIHDRTHPAELFNPSYSAKMAYSISDHGTNWSAWTAYTSGSYKRYLGVARAAVRKVTHPSFPRLQARVDGKAFPAIADSAVTYLRWSVLSKWGIPHKYLRHGKFSIDGKTVQGIVYEGDTYLNWGSIPGIHVTKVNGEFNFTDSYQGSTANGS